MKKQLSLTVGALVLAGISAAVLAGPGFGGFGGCDGDGAGYWGEERGDRAGHYSEARGERMAEHLDRALDLTDAQKAQISALMDAHQQARGERGAMRGAMMALDPGSPDYEAKVAELAKQQSQAMAQRMMEGAKVHAEIYAVLTPEQQTQYRALQERMGDRRGHQGRWH